MLTFGSADFNQLLRVTTLILTVMQLASSAGTHCDIIDLCVEVRITCIRTTMLWFQSDVVEKNHFIALSSQSLLDLTISAHNLSFPTDHGKVLQVIVPWELL